MGGTVSDILPFQLEQHAKCLLIVTLREILMPACGEDCLNNASAGARRDGIYGPDTEFGRLFRGKTT